MAEEIKLLADTIRARVADRLHWLDLTAITAAQKANLPRDTIRNLFRRDSALPRADTLLAMAQALDTTVAFLVGETVNPGVERWAAEEELEEAVKMARPIPVRAELTDGIRDFHAQPLDYLDINVAGFSTSDLSAFVIADGAMDEYYEIGRYVIAAPISQAGFQSGDHVVCLRVVGGDIAEGMQTETFLREYVIGPSGPELVAKSRSSSHPSIAILELKPFEIRFGGVVVADFKPRARIVLPETYDWGR